MSGRPPFSPMYPTQLTCYACSGDLRREIVKYANGKIQCVRFFCDACKYGFEPSMQYSQGSFAPYEEPKPVEKVVEEKGAQENAQGQAG